MTARTHAVEAFLAKTIWKDWDRKPIAGDASARRYTRLELGAQSVVLMDDPADDAATKKFAAIAQRLTANGLSAPHILAHEPATGLMILTDLGNTDVARWLAGRPQDATKVYTAAADVLAKLQSLALPDDLTRLTPLVGAEMITITGTYYSGTDVSALANAVKAALARFAGTPDTLALRDFHAENLIWRDGHQGSNRIGLLDFQDAFVAPAGYDLASLLRDVRRDIPQSLVEETIAYFAIKAGHGADFSTQVACLGVQRNLRILGVFSRLAKVDGKTRYLQFLPRVWDHILADLNDPALADLKRAVLNQLPAPTPEFCERLRP